MTEQEAIKWVNDRMCYGRGKWSEHHQPVIDEYWQAGEMAIQALKKHIPMKPRIRTFDINDNCVKFYICKSCGYTYAKGRMGAYCSACGQKIDWSKKNETAQD